LAEVTARHV